MPKEFTRALTIVLLTLVMMGFRSAERAGAQGALGVVPTTGTYPGAPRSVQVLDVTLLSGQHLWFDRDLCRTFAWRDTDNATALATPQAVGTRWPATDLTVYRNFPGQYSLADGGLWASEWGTGRQPHFQGYTTTATSVTFTCDLPSVDGTDAAHRYTAAITYTDQQRRTGKGFGLNSAITPPAGVTGVGAATARLTGVGAIGGSNTGLWAWDFTGDGNGVRAYPPFDGVSYDLDIWAILTHPQGAVVLQVPNVHDVGAFGTWNLIGGTGFTASRATAGSEIVFTWMPGAGRATPQQYLDARYGLYAEQQAALGLGPQHTPLTRVVGGGGRSDFASLGNIATWVGDGFHPVDWGQRYYALSTHLPMYHTTNGTASGIDGVFNLEQDAFLPDASDLPGLIPSSSGLHTSGTLAQFRDGLNLLRILGMNASYWTQWFYHTCADPTQISHYDLSSHQSGYHTLHPDLIANCGDTPNYSNPAVFTELRDRSAQYWLGYGLQGRFQDSDHQIPFRWDGWFPSFVDFYAWYARQGGYITAEVPDSFLGPLYYNQGSAYAISGREWGAPFAFTGSRRRLCLGVEGIGAQDCQRAADYAGGVTGVAYDPASGRRAHLAGGSMGGGTIDNYEIDYAYDRTVPGHSAAAKAEMRYAGQMQDRFGQPDRVELLAPTQAGANPWPALLSRALGAGPNPDANCVANGTCAMNPDELAVTPTYQLPWAGVIQVDGEQIAYFLSTSDTGLNNGTGYLSNTIRGFGGTAPAPHAVGAPITLVGNDPLHWTYGDAYWVYGTGSNEAWIKYSDGSVWQPGGSVAAGLPTVSSVVIAAGGSGTGAASTITYTTDVPARTWVEYDTYGSAEPHNGDRPAGWWPNYLHKTNLQDSGAPPLATTHSRTLPALTPGALYHYSVVARGPAQTRTQDATFVAGAAQATYSISASPSTVAPGGPVTLTIHDGAPADWHAWGRVNQTTNEWGFLDCGQTGPNPPGVTDAVCTLPAPTTPGTYTYALIDNDPARTVLASSNPITVVAAATATPTRTATPAATSTPTRTATATPSPTPVATATATATCELVVQRGGVFTNIPQAPSTCP